MFFSIKTLQKPLLKGSELLYYIKWGFESRLKHRTYFIDSVDIYDFKCPYELFKASYTTKLISKAIFNLQGEKKPLNDFMILDYLEKNKVKFCQTQFLEIMTTSWVTYETMIKYINMLKEITKEEDLKNKVGGIL